MTLVMDLVSSEPWLSNHTRWACRSLNTMQLLSVLLISVGHSTGESDMCELRQLWDKISAEVFAVFESYIVVFLVHKTSADL